MQLLRFTLTFLGLSAWFGCSLDHPEPTPYSAPLHITVTQDHSVNHIQWSELAVTGFQEYVILQSADSIPDAPEPVISQNVSVLRRITSRDITSIRSIHSRLSDKVCYKLYGKLESRYLQSPTVCVDGDVLQLGGFADNVAFDPLFHHVVVFDRLNHQFRLFDLQSETLENKTTDLNLSFPILDLQRTPEGDKVYAFDQSTSQVKAYSFPALELLNTRSLGINIQAGLAYGQYLYVSAPNVVSGFQILHRQSLNTIDSDDGISNSRNIVAFGSDPVTVLDVSDFGIETRIVNASGQITSQDYTADGITQVGHQQSCDFNATHYIGGRFATIVDSEAQIVRSLLSSSNHFSLLNRFIQEDQYAAVIMTDNITTHLELYSIQNLPQTQKIAEWELPTANYVDMFGYNGLIYIVGVDFSSGNQQSFMLKIPLP